jgi:hypothetical protein
MNESPDVLEQVPAGGGMNKPASGTYGEKTELAALQAELPSSGPAPARPPMSPTPPGAGARPTASTGLPKGLMVPTQRPDVPVSTPLAGPAADPMAGAVDDRQRRLRLLDILSQSPEATPAVRQWAETFKQKLIARG